MRMHDFYALFVVSLLMTSTLVVACSQSRPDYWGSLSEGVKHVERHP